MAAAVGVAVGVEGVEMAEEAEVEAVVVAAVGEVVGVEAV